MATALQQRSGLEGVGDRGRRYSAFISYSHADGAFAKRLHRALEAYRLPHRALAHADGSALTGARLKPLFRDIDELSAAHDLTAAVREAIAQSTLSFTFFPVGSDTSAAVNIGLLAGDSQFPVIIDPWDDNNGIVSMRGHNDN